MTRILGIDPGSAHVGWGIVDTGPRASQLALVASGTIDAPRQTLASRLLFISTQLTGIIAAHAPRLAAMEAAFFAKNARTALVLGHARGAIMLCLAQQALWADEYSPKTIKQALGSGGGSTKEQVAHMVRVILGPTAALGAPANGADMTDALAVAICHAQHLNSQRWRQHDEKKP